MTALHLDTTPELEFVRPYIMQAIPDAEWAGPDQAEAIISLGTAVTAGVPVLRLDLPHVIGTHMTGLPREMVNAIGRGTFFHIPGITRHINTVHAADVASACALLAGENGHYTLTDGSYPTADDLAEALAARIDGKRILTMNPRLARWFYGRRTLDERSTDEERIYIPQILTERGWRPTPVCDYLRTHIYDETSL